jgi:hypothetical protein
LPKLADDLRAYEGPANYPAIFEHNFAVVSTVGDRPAVAGLVSHLARTSGLATDDALLDLQRWLLNAHEYFPDQLAGRRADAARGVVALLLLARPLAAEGLRSSEVIVDAWYPDAAQQFYGPELLSLLGDRARVAVLDVTGARRAGIRPALTAVRRWAGTLRHVRRVAREEAVDLGTYARLFLASCAVGEALAQAAPGATLVTGNDNGFPPIRARRAGMRQVAIENGVRRRISDSSFARAEPPAPETDVVFVSSLEDGDLFDRTFEHFSMEFERQAIAAVNRLAETSELSVAYYPRSASVHELLARLGLVSDAVTYGDWRPGGVYDAVERARVVLSSCSTVGLEAMALGRPNGYLNLSGNSELNPGARSAGIEWDGDGSLETFAHGLLARPATPGEFSVQSPTYLSDVGKIVALTSDR